jgi:hypothetical protein
LTGACVAAWQWQQQQQQQGIQKKQQKPEKRKIRDPILAKRMIKAAPVKSKSMISAAAGRAAAAAVVPGSQSTEIEMNASRHSPSGLLEEDKKFPSPSPSSPSLNGKKKKECDGMEQALILKGELDRVLRGL